MIAFWDIIYIFIQFWRRFISYVYQHFGSLYPLYAFYDVLQSYFKFIVNVAKFASLLLTILVGIERFIAIRYPLRVQRVFNLKKIMIVFSMFVLSCFIYEIPDAHYTYRYIAPTKCNLLPYVVKDHWGWSRNFLTDYLKVDTITRIKILVYYKNIFPLAVYSFAPLAALVVVNILCIRAFLGARAEQKKISNKYNTSNELIIKIIAIVTMNFILEFPYFFYMVIQNYFNFVILEADPFTGQWPTDTPLAHLYGNQLFLAIFNFFSTLNNFSNFFAYVVSGKKFRMLTLQTLRCK